MVDIGCGWVSNGLTRTRFDKPECRAYAEAWALAVLDRYTNDERLGSVKLGEYFPNANAAGTPSDLDKVAYEAGYEAFLERLAAEAPRDASGRRVNIHQSNPIFTNKQLVCSDMARIGIGISASDQFGFGETQTNFDCRKSLHGVVPMAVPGDQVEIVRDNSKWTWDGTPNPWGYTLGQSVTLSVPHIAWFYGHDGPMPMDQEFILAPGIMEQFQVAMDQFGPGGSLRDKWGGTPYEK